MSDRLVRLGPSAAGPAEERGPLELRLQRRGVDRRGDDRDVGEPCRQVLLGGGQPVEPGGVVGAIADLWAVEQLEEERLVGGPATHQDRRLGQRAAQPGERLLAVAAVGDDLGDHRVVLRWDRVARGDSGVDANPGADSECQCLDHSRCGREVALRVLGVETSFDGVAERRWRVTLQAAAGGDVELQFHQVEPGRQLRDRMLHLQSRVHLEEGEQLLVGLVQELDGAGIHVPGQRGKSHGRRP